MDFAETPRVTALRERLLVFMDEVVYPNERTYAEQHAAAANRWETPPVIEEMKTRAQEVGLWNLFLPESRHGGRLTNLRVRAALRDHGSLGHRPRVFKLLVILEQIYTRFQRGQTQDQRFASLDQQVERLAAKALTLVAR